MGGLLMIVLIVGVFLASHAVPAAPTAERGMEPATRDAEQVRREDGVRRCHELKGWKGVARLNPKQATRVAIGGSRLRRPSGELVEPRRPSAQPVLRQAQDEDEPAARDSIKSSPARSVSVTGGADAPELDIRRAARRWR